VLPPRARLRSRAEFTETTRRGERAGTPALVIHLSREDRSVTPKAGFVVSRSVGSAVTRNLVRRRLRHLVRDRLERLPAGSRLVVRATPAAATQSAASLGAQLDRALDRVGAAGGAR
jgi:ribonuclease P protein component